MISTFDVNAGISAVWVNVDDETGEVLIVEEGSHGGNTSVSVYAANIRKLIGALEEAAKKLGV